MDDITVYLSGRKLYGDEFSPNEIEKWFDEEKNAYSDLVLNNKSSYSYSYHELNNKHGYSKLKRESYNNVLGLGSACGDEFKPIINKIKQITIVEPSAAFSGHNTLLDRPCKYIKPNIYGNMPFEDETFDLITCFGVMHHIPNISYVMNELNRVLCRDGEMLIREPVVSMGDWTVTRKGLTRNERGIPLNIFIEIIKTAGFTIKANVPCDFSLVSRVSNKFGVAAYNNSFLTSLDCFLSYIFRWNSHYHPKNIWHKFAPASRFFVLGK